MNIEERKKYYDPAMSDEDNEFVLGLGEEIETVFKSVPPIKKLDKGFGYLGVLLRNKNEDTLQCHICGKWFKSLNQHVLSKHKLLSKEYKHKYGLPLTYPLVSVSTSAKRSVLARQPYWIQRLRNAFESHKKDKFKKSKNMKYRYGRACYTVPAHENKYGLCTAQMDSRFAIVADIVGRTPTCADLKKYDSKLLCGIYYRYKTFNNFCKSRGLRVNNYGRFDRDKVIAELRSFSFKHGRVPKQIDWKIRQDNQTCGAEIVRKHFGSWRRALLAAGFEPSFESRHTQEYKKIA